MSGDVLPDKHHVSRLCLPKTVQDNQLLGAAFLPRAEDNYLSVNWLECLKCKSRAEEIVAVQNTYISKLNFSNKARIAVLNVGITRLMVRSKSSDNRNLDFLHMPEDNDASHSGIYNIKNDDMEIAELILSTINQENIYKAKQ